MRPRPHTVLLAAVAALALAAPTAHAGVYVYESGPGLVYVSGAGEVDDISITFLPATSGSGGAYQVLQSGDAKMSVAFPCSKPADYVVRCPVTTRQTINVELWDGDDRLVVTTDEPVIASGGDGNDVVGGGYGDDRISDSSGVNELRGGFGDDVLTGGAGPDRILGHQGDDTLLGGDGNDVLDGGWGSDAFSGEPGSDTYLGDLGLDTLSYESRTTGVSVTRGVGHGDDGSPGEGDSISELVDVIVGGSGHDSLSGAGSAGDLTLRGGGGEDRLTGGLENDTLDGGPGADLLLPSPGRDGFSGGGELDTVSYEGEDDPLEASIDGRANDGPGAESDNIVSDVEVLAGGDGDDRLTGSPRADTLIGNGGDDTLTGGAGRDILRGELGDDRIVSADAAADVDDCGPGDDLALPDGRDGQIECDRVDYRGVPGPIVIPADPSLVPEFILPPHVLSRGGLVALELGCGGSRSCAGEIVLRTARPVDTRGLGARAAGRRKRVTLGRQSFRLRAGRTGVVRVRLAPDGRRLVRRARRLSLTGAVTAGRGRAARRARVAFVLRREGTRR